MFSISLHHYNESRRVLFAYHFLIIICFLVITLSFQAISKKFCQITFFLILRCFISSHLLTDVWPLLKNEKLNPSKFDYGVDELKYFTNCKCLQFTIFLREHSFRRKRTKTRPLLTRNDFSHVKCSQIQQWGFRGS